MYLSIGLTTQNIEILINSSVMVATDVTPYLSVFSANYGLVLIITSETELEISGDVQRF